MIKSKKSIHLLITKIAWITKFVSIAMCQYRQNRSQEIFQLISTVLILTITRIVRFERYSFIRKTSHEEFNL